MHSRRRVLAHVALTPIFTAANAWALPAPARADVIAAMRRATAFMVDKVAVRGGYVWSYLPDFSRRWGEMEAYPSMIWTQAPGTPEMGQIFLDAYRATGDDYYYQAAAQTADALIAGQHPSGGWNYIIDFDGEDSIKRWYETIGANGWRLEEFQHYYGNATFDDHATVESGRLLLRIYLEKREQRFRAALEKAVGFVLESQYDHGGWPQRWPPAPAFENHGHPDYTGHITLNDEVAEQNIDFLLLVMQQLGMDNLRAPIQRAMDLYPRLRQSQPTPGWALQYTQDLNPAAGRTYEPRAISPHTTAAAIEQLIRFYELTGDRKYLEPIPEPLAWLEAVEAPPEARTPNGYNYFRYYEVGTGRQIAVRRRGSNAQNGEYYANFDMTGEKAQRRIDVAALRARYAAVSAKSPEQATVNSVWFARGPSLLPRYVVTQDIIGSDLNTQGGARATDSAAISALLASLNADGYWPTRLTTTSHPYRGPGPATPPAGFVDRGQVGDEWDTSPFTEPDGPMGISSGVYIRNMSLLIQHLAATQER